MKKIFLITSLFLCLCFGSYAQFSIEDCGNYYLVKNVEKLKFDFIKKDLITSMNMDYVVEDNVKKYYLTINTNEIFFDTLNNVVEQTKHNGFYRYELEPQYVESFLFSFKEMVSKK